MKAAIISQGSESSQWTASAMRKYFKQVDELSVRNIEVNIETGVLEVLHNGEKLPHYDCVYPKGSFKYDTLLQTITTALQRDCYIPYRPESFLFGHDKLLTQIDLQSKKVPMPKAYVASSDEQAKRILEKIHYPIIMKFPQGTQGKGVMFAESYPVASSLLDALSTLKQPFIIQEYIETGSTDVRAMVVGNDVVAAMRRKAIPGEKRANIHMGATGEALVLDPLARNVAIKAARALGLDICAVDMLETPRGAMVIEVNVSPGLQGITAATQVDIADKIAQYLFKRTTALVESRKTKHAQAILEDLDIEPSIKEMISTISMRGNRILLPESVTKISKIKADDEVTLDIGEGTFCVKKSRIGHDG